MWRLIDWFDHSYGQFRLAAWLALPYPQPR
jgi:hypothetical protein